MSFFINEVYLKNDMIQIIGIMIAFYIFARLSELMDSKNIGRGTKFMAGLSAVVTFLCLIGLLDTPSNY